jgi:hypothetical protein
LLFFKKSGLTIIDAIFINYKLKNTAKDFILQVKDNDNLSIFPSLDTNLNIKETSNKIKFEKNVRQLIILKLFFSELEDSFHELDFSTGVSFVSSPFQEMPSDNFKRMFCLRFMVFLTSPAYTLNYQRQKFGAIKNEYFL